MRYSRQERQAHIELWRESGLSKAAYCRSAGLPYHCLVSWCAAAARDDAGVRHEASDDDAQRESGAAFMELPAPVAWSDRSSGLGAAARVDCGNGRWVLIAADADPAWAGRLVQAVASC